MSENKIEILKLKVEINRDACRMNINAILVCLCAFIPNALILYQHPNFWITSGSLGVLSASIIYSFVFYKLNWLDCKYYKELLNYHLDNDKNEIDRLSYLINIKKNMGSKMEDLK